MSAIGWAGAWRVRRNEVWLTVLKHTVAGEFAGWLSASTRFILLGLIGHDEGVKFRHIRRVGDRIILLAISAF